MQFFRKVLRVLGIIIGVFLLIILVFCIYVWNVSDIKPPHVEDRSALTLQRKSIGATHYTIGDNWIRTNRWGLHEMYISGAPFERGVKMGKLSAEQIVAQEVAFTGEIRRMIPSEKYLRFLKYVVGFINRDLPDHITDEYKHEIYGISHAAADSFNWIGNNYARILNYHAAHDIGHALQNMMLVGCTSFGVWGDKTESGSMLIGRNFDFWVGDKFAENKIVTFEKPDKGYAFASITWGGFTGVVSGMNEKGLTVTINAARSDIPFSAATPVSLVAREVLQYASTIQEAIAIAKRRKMFVSESFLVGSAIDKKAVVIEKTPGELSVYDPQQDNIQCTNHYQSDLFLNQKLNLEQKDKSASVYRYKRLQELMQQSYPLNPQKMANILRDRRGVGGANIGDGNEKAINQLIAHHSIIFQPDSLRFWVSTAPWQLGEYVCYDLKKVFALKGLQHDTDVAQVALNIAPDTFLQTADYKNFLSFRMNKMALLFNQPVDTAEVVHSNPHFYDAYRIAGDYCMKKGWYAQAIDYYKKALLREVATKDEREAIANKIEKCKDLLQKQS
ncbi:MAG TPA: C45 family autoproteolytic acyltransferase/hydrolase [Flavipsychrobacter sp.]|nr:C45 family autoproteolytic acyltransferase/hydrolase [Flavipsychrobacter sp.]